MAITRNVKQTSDYRKTTLKNGLRVVTEQLPSVRSISIGVWIDTGSRNEQLEESGLSHYLEHMVFKGTRRRNAKQIASSLESLGGSLNGFTSREQTCFTARILDEYLEEALDVLSDMVCNASLSPANMKRERLVICEEIKESLDTPSDHIHDLFAHTFWGSHPLGRPIMGSQEIIMGMSRARMCSYRERNYRSGSVVISASGSVPHSRFVRLVREKFHFPAGKTQPPEKYWREKDQDIRVVHNETNQTHCCVGFSGVSFASPERLPALALSSRLGGGMSSVLFQKIREERGLAYSVYSYLDVYRDSGVFGTYVGTDRDHLKQALDIILKEFKRIRTRKLSLTALEKVKSQIKGHLTLSLESTSARMSRLARQELMIGSYIPLKQTLKDIDKISASDILDVANLMLDESRMAVAVLGPTDENVFGDVS